MGYWCRVQCNCPDRKPVDPHQPFGPWVCGHEGGAARYGSPYVILEIGKTVARLTEGDRLWDGEFALFTMLVDRQYVDDYLELSPAETELWQLEIEELLAIEAGDKFFPYAIGQQWAQHWTDYFRIPWRQEHEVSISKLLTECLELCQVSQKTGNPIEFYF